MSQESANALIDLAFRRHADELRGCWQIRALTQNLHLINGVLRPRDLLGAVMLSVLAHNIDDAMPVLLRIAFPGYQGIGTPMLTTAARIAKTGHVMADIVTSDGQRVRNQSIFLNTRVMEKRLRKLADAAKLSDSERIEMFDYVKRWVVCDYRLDPSMNPNDPDAKRLTVH